MCGNKTFVHAYVSAVIIVYSKNPRPMIMKRCA